MPEETYGSYSFQESRIITSCNLPYALFHKNTLLTWQETHNPPVDKETFKIILIVFHFHLCRWEPLYPTQILIRVSWTLSLSLLLLSSRMISAITNIQKNVCLLWSRLYRYLPDIYFIHSVALWVFCWTNTCTFNEVKGTAHMPKKAQAFVTVLQRWSLKASH